jgi:hypothetical protein
MKLVHDASSQTAPKQEFPAQSELTRQALPFRHLVLQSGPPQSLSVSLPFFTKSVQIGAEQRLLVQTPSLQSEGRSL